jgi:serine protease Do
VAGFPVGKKVSVEYLRDGKATTATVTIGELKAERPAAEGEMEEEEPSSPGKPDKLGLKVGPVPEQLAQDLDLESGGVEVRSIDPSGIAFEKGIRQGDVIVELNRKKIENVDNYVKASKSLRKGDSVLLLVKRTGGVTLFVAFTLQ